MAKKRMKRVKKKVEPKKEAPKKVVHKEEPSKEVPKGSEEILEEVGKEIGEVPVNAQIEPEGEDTADTNTESELEDEGTDEVEIDNEPVYLEELPEEADDTEEVPEVEDVTESEPELDTSVHTERDDTSEQVLEEVGVENEPEEVAETNPTEFGEIKPLEALGEDSGVTTNKVDYEANMRDILANLEHLEELKEAVDKNFEDVLAKVEELENEKGVEDGEQEESVRQDVLEEEQDTPLEVNGIEDIEEVPEQEEYIEDEPEGEVDSENEYVYVEYESVEPSENGGILVDDEEHYVTSEVPTDEAEVTYTESEYEPEITGQTTGNPETEEEVYSLEDILAEETFKTNNPRVDKDSEEALTDNDDEYEEQDELEEAPMEESLVEERLVEEKPKEVVSMAMRELLKQKIELSEEEEIVQQQRDKERESRVSLEEGLLSNITSDLADILPYSAGKRLEEELNEKAEALKRKMKEKVLEEQREQERKDRESMELRAEYAQMTEEKMKKSGNKGLFGRKRGG